MGVGEKIIKAGEDTRPSSLYFIFMQKKILLIIGTHGNERIGLEVVTRLRLLGLDKYFDYLWANPLAIIENKRYIEKDLNRSYPGNKTSKVYEVRLAAYNLRIAKKYRYVIDLHEASSGTDDFIIVPKMKISKKFPLSWVPLKRVLLWPDPSGPISQILPQAVELEFGMKGKNREQVIKRATTITRTFINSVSGKEKLKETKKKEIYSVYGKLLKTEYEKNVSQWRDFRVTTVKGEDFLPLLVGQYLDQGIVCYKMKKL